MQLGEIIANTFAALLVMGVMAVVFLIAGKPLWPQYEAKMEILPPTDAMTTGSVKRSTRPKLPEAVDPRLVQPRPVPAP